MATRVTEVDPGIYTHVHAAPLVEIFAVTLHCDDGTVLLKDKCHIYGKISVTDKLDDTRFNMYHRQKTNPELLSFGDTLLLETDDAFIIPSEFACMKVKLYDGDMVIANDSFILDRPVTTSEDDWAEDYQVKRISGSKNNLYVLVHYATFPYAVTATVSVLFFSKDDNFDSKPREKRNDSSTLIEPFEPTDIAHYEENDCSIYAHLYGTLNASGVLKANSTKIPYCSSLLFRKRIEDSVHVKSGGFIELSRSEVVVPSYSTLKFDAAFFNRYTQLPIATGSLEFIPQSNRTCRMDIKGCDGRIRVRVSWKPAFVILYKYSPLEWLPPPEINESMDEDTVLKTELLSEHNYSAISSNDSILMKEVSLPASALRGNCILPYCERDYPLIEVFSVVVCSKDGMPFKFYGSIDVFDGSHSCIFDQDESSPQVCPNSGMVVILKGEAYTFTTINDFCVYVNLKDISGAIISKAPMHLRGIDTEVYGNRRLCSVVRGELGFAAVHYSIFPDGVCARVSVKLVGKCLPCTVKGEIYACNVTEEYFRCYQEKLFQSILFYNAQDGVRFDPPSTTLPLVKSTISLPRHSYLIITANLTVSHGASFNDVGYLKGSVKIMKDNRDSPVIIGEGDLILEVSVKLSDGWTRGFR